MAEFYVETLNTLVERRVLDRSMRVLVVCAAEDDRDALQECGFRRVVISNLDRGVGVHSSAPYEFSHQDAESLEFSEGEFDICIAHSGLHHCRSPHQGLLEMYRVARVAAIGFEPLDNFITRLSQQWGFGERYEVGSVAGHAFEKGGVRDTAIPNHVYRWTEREIEKTIRSFAPVARPRFHYFYRTRINWIRMRSIRNPLKRLAFRVAAGLALSASRILPRESNNFAFCVVKPQIPDELFPWLRQESGQLVLDRSWITDRYRPAELPQLGDPV